MKYLIALVSLSFTLYSQAQSIKPKSPTVKTTQREFKNQGEQEDYWAEQLFAREYKKQATEKYNGPVIIGANGTCKYGDRVLIVSYTNDSLKAIFEKGIFYPQLITGNGKVLSKSKEQIEAMSPEQKTLYYLTQTDTISISNFHELKFLSNSPRQKRFEFWLFRKGLLNPTVYFIELTNEKATPATRLAAFIDKAAVTFVKEGWIVI